MNAVILKPDFMLVILRFVTTQCDEITQTKSTCVICPNLKCGLWISTAVARGIKIVAHMECADSGSANDTDLHIDLTPDAT